MFRIALSHINRLLGRTDCPHIRSSARISSPLRARLSLEQCEAREVHVAGFGANFVVNSTADLSDANRSDGIASTGNMVMVRGAMVPEVTLRAAIEQANTIGGDLANPATISFADLVSPAGGGQPAVTASVMLTQPIEDIRTFIVIDGIGRDLLTVTRDTTATAFHYFSIATAQGSPTCSATFKNMTIRDAVATNPQVSEKGAAIRNAAGLVLDSVKFVNNKAKEGGAVFTTGTLGVNNCVFEDNHAIGQGNDGGAIDITAGQATITGSTFTGNSADGGKGGAIAVNNAQTRLNVTDTDFSANWADNGGAIYSSIGHEDTGLSITRGHFWCNWATSDAGAVYLSTTNARIDGVEFDGNYANNGGAIMSKTNRLLLLNSTFNANQASNAGNIVIYVGILGDTVRITLYKDPTTEADTNAGITAADLIQWMPPAP